MTEHDSLYKGIDAVIHLAAIPSPGHAVSSSFHALCLRARHVPS